MVGLRSPILSQYMLSDFSRVYRKVFPSVVMVRTATGEATGFVVSGSKVVATCAHVVDTESIVRVRFSDGTMIRAEVLSTDVDSDLAFLQLPKAADVPGLAFAEPDRIRPGTPIALLGNTGGNGLALTSGVVSALRQSEEGVAWIQTTAPMNPGVSGAPLFDLRGRIVGMATSGLRDAQAVNFALAGMEIRRHLRALEPRRRRRAGRRACSGCRSVLPKGADTCRICGKKAIVAGFEGVEMSKNEKPLSKRAQNECAQTITAALQEVEIRVEPSFDREFESLVWEFWSNRSKVFVVFSPGVGRGLLQVRALVAQTPKKNLLVLYRRLLELNAEHLPSCALGITEDYVTLATARSVRDLRQSHVKEMLVAVAEAAARIDEHLIEKFGCKPISAE